MTKASKKEITALFGVMFVCFLISFVLLVLPWGSQQIGPLGTYLPVLASLHVFKGFNEYFTPLWFFIFFNNGLACRLILQYIPFLAALAAASRFSFGFSKAGRKRRILLLGSALLGSLAVYLTYLAFSWAAKTSLQQMGEGLRSLLVGVWIFSRLLDAVVAFSALAPASAVRGTSCYES